MLTIPQCFPYKLAIRGWKPRMPPNAFLARCDLGAAQAPSILARQWTQRFDESCHSHVYSPYYLWRHTAKDRAQSNTLFARFLARARQPTTSNNYEIQSSNNMSNTTKILFARRASNCVPTSNAGESITVCYRRAAKTRSHAV
jgi:hypothetical protein